MGRSTFETKESERACVGNDGALRVLRLVCSASVLQFSFACKRCTGTLPNEEETRREARFWGPLFVIGSILRMLLLQLRQCAQADELRRPPKPCLVGVRIHD